MQNNEQRIKQIEKEFIKLGIIDAVPMMMIALGLHTKFSGGEPLFDFLKDDAVVNSLFVIAAPVVLWCMYRSVKLAIERKRIDASVKNNR